MRSLRLIALVVLALALLGAPPAGAAPCGTDNLLAGKLPHTASGTTGDAVLLTDGKLGTEGADWNVPDGVTLGATAVVTYDLGTPREVSAVVLQGDANDTYQISGALEDTPTAFKTLAEVPNVVAQGHGLRARGVELPAATVRYLRVGEPKGDGFYSIAELSAYCQKPATFPPAVAATPEPAAEPKNGSSFNVFYGAAVLFFAWVALRFLRRS